MSAALRLPHVVVIVLAIVLVVRSIATPSFRSALSQMR